MTTRRRASAGSGLRRTEPVPLEVDERADHRRGVDAKERPERLLRERVVRAQRQKHADVARPQAERLQSVLDQPQDGLPDAAEHAGRVFEQERRKGTVAARLCRRWRRGRAGDAVTRTSLPYEATGGRQWPCFGSVPQLSL